MRIRLRIDRLQQLLAGSALSQNHWAIRLGLSRGHWSDIVNGRHRYPSARTRQRMLEELGVAMDDLFEIEPVAVSSEDIDFRAGIADRFLIDRELGQGAMGAVYLARDVARGRLVALKTISPEAASGIGPRALLREIGAAAQLHHPNILPIYDSGMVADHAFLVMPWVRQGSLRDRLLREGRLDPACVVRIGEGLANGLAYAHAEHVLHCDIKPENILLHGDHAYLSDFGISRMLHLEFSEFRARGTLDLSAGTPAYVSPEQASGDGAIDGRSDTYSLGCVVFEMLAGRPPFEGSNTMEIVSRRFTSPTPRLADSNLPVGVAESVERAMALRPIDRFASPVAFAAALGAATAGKRLAFAGMRRSMARRVDRARELASSRGMARGGDVFRGIAQDLRHAWRGLARSPRFLLATVLPLALGIGAGVTFLRIVDDLMFRPPPHVTAPGEVGRLVIDQTVRDGRREVTNSLAWVDLEALSQETTVFSEVAGYFTVPTSLGTGEEAAPIVVTLATPSFFPLLGVTPALGRFFMDGEDVRGAHQAPCVVSDAMWRSRYGGSRAILGARLPVGRVTCEVVGVAPKGFRGVDLRNVDVWMPVQTGAVERVGRESEVWTTDRSHWVRVLARKRPGMTEVATNDAAMRAYRSFSPRQRDLKLEGTFRIEPVHLARGSLRSTAATQAVLLSAGAAALLVLVVANLLNAFLARDIGRWREVAIRVALGGGRWRLLRAHVAESALVAAVASVLALLLARSFGPPVQRVLFPPSVGWNPETIDVRVAFLAFALAQGVGLCVSAAMVRRTRARDIGSLLRGSAGVRNRASARARTVLVGLQATVSFVLLAASLAFVRSFHKATHVDLGYTLDELVSVQIATGTLELTRAEERELYRELHRQVSAMPGVVSSSLGYTNPWWNNRTEDVFSETRDSMPQVPGWGGPLFDAAGPDYLRTMNIRLREGRWISVDDRAGSAPVLVVNEALAHFYWPGATQVLGRCLRIGADTMPCRTIVGITRNQRMTGRLDGPPLPAYFIPEAQSDEHRLSPSLFVRPVGSATPLMPALRQAAQTIMPGLPYADVARVRDHLEPMLSPWRLGAIAFTALGVVAMVVALAGLYAVLAFLVAERRHEFAVRAAIGASHRQIARPVTRQALLTVLGGLIAGVLILAIASPQLEVFLFQVTLLDPLAMAIIATMVLLLAWRAALGPARVAARQDPMQALRSD